MIAAVFTSCSAPSINSTATPPADQEKGGQEEFGPYELVENWLQPLPDGDDGVKHEGWTWGSVGAVFAETPDRIWIAQRGELPLPKDAKPWTPYGMLTPERTATGNDDGLDATCQKTESVAGRDAITMSFSSWIGMASSFSHGRSTTSYSPRRADAGLTRSR